jgi:DNA-binding NtrC family response regulator
MDQPVLLGASPTTEALRRQIEFAARSNAKVLIVGETGAGKEVVARAIHERSARRARPFVAINCGGIPDTLLESELFGHARGSFTGAYRDKQGLIRQAQGGTLFLDELGEMGLRMQAVLLRFAESGELQTVGGDGPSVASDVRLICATNCDLHTAMENGAFRRDLYYRLNVVEIRVMALRERRTDIPVLLRHFLQRAAEAHGRPSPELAGDAEELLVQYRWPGNVRELKNVAERLVLAEFRGPIRANDLPWELREPPRRFADAHLDPAGNGSGATPSESAPTTAMWERFAAGEDFWTVVYHPYKRRELTRDDLSDLIDSGLRKTAGSYRALIGLFNLPTTDYKRFHAFLTQHRCNLPVAAYRHRVRDRNDTAQGRTSTDVTPLRPPAAEKWG